MQPHECYNVAHPDAEDPSPAHRATGTAPGKGRALRRDGLELEALTCPPGGARAPQPQDHGRSEHGHPPLRRGRTRKGRVRTTGGVASTPNTRSRPGHSPAPASSTLDPISEAPSWRRASYRTIARASAPL